jgi:lysozyme
MLEELKALLIHHEGLRLRPYRCTAGYFSIGVGRNLETTGITEREAIFLLHGDILRCMKEAERVYPWFSGLTEVRQVVIASMVFNLGILGFGRFKRLIACLEKGRWTLAAAEMLDSHWATQVGRRARDLAEMMRSSSYPPWLISSQPPPAG